MDKIVVNGTDDDLFKKLIIDKNIDIIIFVEDNVDLKCGQFIVHHHVCIDCCCFMVYPYLCEDWRNCDTCLSWRAEKMKGRIIGASKTKTIGVVPIEDMKKFRNTEHYRVPANIPCGGLVFIDLSEIDCVNNIHIMKNIDDLPFGLSWKDIANTPERKSRTGNLGKEFEVVTNKGFMHGERMDSHEFEQFVTGGYDYVMAIERKGNTMIIKPDGEGHCIITIKPYREGVYDVIPGKYKAYTVNDSIYNE